MKFWFSFFLFFNVYFAQVTGLTNWDLFIDPGHSQDENMGINGYSEAKEVLQVGLHLMDIFTEQTDIDTVFIARTNDNQSVSLYQRTNYANTVSASWYHSVHSDASANTNTNRTLLLWGQLDSGAPDPPTGGEEMSDYMVDVLTQGMRIESTGSWGDCSFYTWSDYCANSGGPYLYVNRNTNMPSELSEQGHHTNPAQNQLVMNVEYKRMLAYLLYWSILDYHQIERPNINQLAGQIRDIESLEPINGAQVQVGQFQYTTDTYESLFNQFSSDENELKNGFYWFENLLEDSIEIIISAEGFYSDTSFISMIDTFITFHDVELLSSQPPVITESIPVSGDTLFPAWDSIELIFSRPMDTLSVLESVILSPQTNVEGFWENNTTLILIPDSLDDETNYVLTILDEAKDIYGHYIDGDENNQEGGNYELHFRTGPADMFPPEVINTFPEDISYGNEILPIINIQFDEILISEGDIASYFMLERLLDNSSIPGDFVYYPVGSKSSICFFPFENLNPNEIYISRLSSGISDIFNNTIEMNQSFSFETGNTDWAHDEIDNLEIDLGNHWWDPQSSGSTLGIISDSTWIGPSSEVINLLYDSNYSMKVNYGWNLSSSDWLIRIYLSGGSPREVIFNNSKVMQAYIFGDGSGNSFRFCVDDNLPNSSSSNHEVSPWIVIDWVGWKLVSWDMSMDGTGSWIGDGNLDGNMRFDSFQLKYNQGQSQFGNIYIDDFRIADNVILSNHETNFEQPFSLGGNFPNPFNSSTEISFSVQNKTFIQLIIYDLTGNKIIDLVQKNYQPGQHKVRWNGLNQNGNEVSSGMYIYTMISDQNKSSLPMILIK